MYQIVLTLTFKEPGGWCKEPGGKDFAMTTTVLEYDHPADADVAFQCITKRYPKSAVYATAVKLY